MRPNLTYRVEGWIGQMSATDLPLWNLSQDGGSTYPSNGWYIIRNDNVNTSLLQDNVGFIALGTNTAPNSSSPNIRSTLFLDLYNAGDIDIWTSGLAQGVVQQNWNTTSFRYQGTGAFSAIRLIMNGGATFRGEFKLYEYLP